MTYRPRIAFVGVDPAARGGIAQFGAHLVQAVEDRADTLVVSYRRLYPALVAAGRQPPDPAAAGAQIDAARLLVPWQPRTWRRAAGELDDFDPDLVVLQWWSPLFAGCVRHLARRSRAAGRRVLVVCHNCRPHEAFPLWQSAVRGALRPADVLVALSDSVAADLADLLGDVRPRVLGHPPNLAGEGSCDAAAWRRRLAIGDAPVALFFGNVREYKGVEDLIDAAPALRGTGARIVIAGECFVGLDRLQRRIAALGVQDVVCLRPGYVPSDEAPGLFALADVVVLPYRRASQSGVLAQALDAGKPAVVTAVGGLPETVGPDGLVVAPGDAGALGAAIRRMLTGQRPVVQAARGATWEAWARTLLAEAGSPQALGSGPRDAPPLAVGGRS